MTRTFARRLAVLFAFVALVSGPALVACSAPSSDPPSASDPVPDEDDPGGDEDGDGEGDGDGDGPGADDPDSDEPGSDEPDPDEPGNDEPSDPTDPESPPPGDDDPLDPGLAYLSEDEAAAHARILKNDAVSIGNGFLDGVLASAVQGVPASVRDVDVPQMHVVARPVPHLRTAPDGADAGELATGTYDFDESTMTWTHDPSPTDSLVANWTSASTGSPAMRLEVHWADEVEARRRPGDEATWTLPTGWTGELLRNGTRIARLKADYTLRTCRGITISEPARIAVEGFAGDGAARVDVHEAIVEATSESDAYASLDVGVRSGSLAYRVTSHLSVAADLTRDEDCWPLEWQRADAKGWVAAQDGAGDVRLARTDVSAEPTVATELDLAVRNGRFVTDGARVDAMGDFAWNDIEMTSKLFLTFAGGVIRDLDAFLNRNGLRD